MRVWHQREAAKEQVQEARRKKNTHIHRNSITIRNVIESLTFIFYYYNINVYCTHVNTLTFCCILSYGTAKEMCMGEIQGYK